jgi:SAM-dependent methyltransferase
MARPSRRSVFFEVHQGLPREGPGDRASTHRALELTGLDPSAELRVADVGCGPGLQTLHLAERLTRARLVAVDLHSPFLRDLVGAAAAAGVAGRVTAVRGDMTRLPVAPASLDLVWCEGAAYIMGVDAALAAWWQLLRPGGVCAFTEVAWLAADPPEPVCAFWRAYPAMTDEAGNRDRVRQRGFELLGDFVLPAAAWWDDYYQPMSERVAALEQRYAGEPQALAELAHERAEIDLYRQFGEWYGYTFLVARKP